jgi:hypothetical protein
VARPGRGSPLPYHDGSDNGQSRREEGTRYQDNDVGD